MITKVQGQTPFQVLTNNFSISPSQEGYTLQISADGKNFSDLFSVAPNTTRLVSNVAANSYYRLSGNASEVSVNWMKTCVTEGGGGESYTAGANISIAQNVISVSGLSTINGSAITAGGNLVIQGGGGSGPIIPAITTQAEYEAISGDVKTGDLIEVEGVDINGDGNPVSGLFGANVQEEEYEGVVRKLIFWGRRDNSDSVIWSNEDYPWMDDNGVRPIDLGNVAFIISPDFAAGEEEAYNGIGFDDDGKPVITRIVPQYDEETGEVTGITREDTAIGGGENVVELTQAEYDALTEYAENTTYIITDAAPINMDDYATTADTTAIEADVATLSGSVADKADKANITANTNQRKFTLWNAQGIVTGTTGSNMYEAQHRINGSYYVIVRAGTNGDMPSIYAPTVSGATGSVLLSAGNTAPTWSSYKFQFITQTAYDALSTKDSTTIYFIVGD